MQMLVLGAGRQGSACAYDLLKTTDARVGLADHVLSDLPGFLKQWTGDRLERIELDVRDEAAVARAFEGRDAVMSAVPYYFNFDLARLAVEAGAHFADLGGNTEIVRQQETLQERAAERGVSVVVDCGLAPGLVNILAADGIRRLDTVETVQLFVGGLPQHPEPPLNYQIVYSLEGALDYYTTPSWVVRDGVPVQVAPLTEVEEVEFPPPLGSLEAFHTAGGLSTMPWVFAGRVKRMEYKTLRYPGHAKIMRAIRELGLLDEEPVQVKEMSVRPRDVFIATVAPKLRKPEGHDLVALKVVVSGTKERQPSKRRYVLLDRYDLENGISAMMRTTGFSLSIVGQLQVAGTAGAPGVCPAFEAIPSESYVAELRRRNIVIDVTE
ncbi:MAG: saccharopine dehydrogenase NADP-binding domain-containing protein [Gemmatimonadetes bacterium]|nr:saccharopine dehydrogenase NADP-binding domain-containing protein [Gemmatimonadota bacterium]